MEQLGETDSVHEDGTLKKSRHRKKHLYNSILQQMEFYFSDSNLSKDRCISQLLQEDPYIPLDFFLKCNKIKKLTSELDDIQKAISKSKVLQLSEDKQKVSRKTPIKVRQNTDECTIYVEKLKEDTTHEWVTSVFAEFGNVTYISIPKYRHSRLNKGFAFVEFETEKEAQSTLEYFENIGCKMPSHTKPEELLSIATFGKEDVENDKSEEQNQSDSDCSSRKRKFSETEDLKEESESKRVKSDSESRENQSVISETEETGGKKKKKLKKEHKKRTYIKEHGLQILSKKEWKKLRNLYLEAQRNIMKEFKRSLMKKRLAEEHNLNKPSMESESTQPSSIVKEVKSTLDFLPGVIVKITFNEPATDQKKLKNDIKALSSDIKFVDFPFSSESTFAYVRFSDAQIAGEFLKQDQFGQKVVLQGDEEQTYWEKIKADRDKKVNKTSKKLRGRDKLLKKAKEAAKHIRFNDNERSERTAEN